MALEWLEQSPDLDTVLIAVGGGGLISGCALWLAGKVKVVAVEPEGSWARCTRRSPPASRSTSRSTVSLPTVSGRNVAAIWCTGSARPACPKACSVSDDAILEAQARLWSEMQVAAEPGGATALAALLGGAYRPAPGERIGVLVCGGNVDPSTLARDGA